MKKSDSYSSKIVHPSSTSQNHIEIDSDSLEEGFYIVDKILDKKKSGKTCKYLVSWKGYSSEHNTWECIKNLSNVKDLIQEYENKISVKVPPTQINRYSESQRKIIKKEYLKIEYENKTIKLEDKKNTGQGHFLFGDSAKQILKAKLATNNILCLVEWENRSNGIAPKNSVISSDVIRQYNKNLLINFYESRIRISSIFEPLVIAEEDEEEIITLA